MTQPNPLKTTFKAIYGMNPTKDRVAYGNNSTRVLLTMTGEENKITIPGVTGVAGKLWRWEFADPTLNVWYTVQYLKASDNSLIDAEDSQGTGTLKLIPKNFPTVLILKAGDPAKHMQAQPNGFNMLLKAKLL